MSSCVQLCPVVFCLQHFVTLHVLFFLLRITFTLPGHRDNLWVYFYWLRWDKLGKFRYDEGRSRMRILSKFWKLCWSSAEVLTNAQSSCVELYGGCCEEPIVFVTFISILSHNFITFAISYTSWYYYSFNCPEYLSCDQIQEGGHGHQQTTIRVILENILDRYTQRYGFTT